MRCEQSRNGLRKGLQVGIEPSRHWLWGYTDGRQLLKALSLWCSEVWMDMENGKEHERHLNKKTVQNCE